MTETIKDQDWAPVYFDDFSVIFLKRNESNQGAINQYEIPKKAFGVI